MVTRRGFLWGARNMVLASSVLPLRGMARLATDSPGDDGQLLIIRVNGGMDTTLGLNPWVDPRPDPRDLYLDEDYPVLFHAKGTDIHLGPSAYALESHARDVSVVGGIFMGTGDLGHDAHRNYMATGLMERNRPHFIAWPAQEASRTLGERVPVIFNEELEIVDLTGAHRAHVDSFSRPGGGVREKVVARASSFATGTTAFAVALDALEKRRRRGETNPLGGRLQWLRERVGDNLNPEHLALAALAQGQASFAQIDWTDFPGLDTHTNFPGRHQSTQRQVWERVASLITLMKEMPYGETDRPLFPDYLTLMVTSEFSRPPFLNNRDGKDHNPLDNSILLGGRGIRGGQRLGAHHLFIRDARREESQLSGCPLDYSTGQVIIPEEGMEEAIFEGTHRDIIRPRNVLRTLGEIFHLGHLFEGRIRPLPGLLRRVS